LQRLTDRGVQSADRYETGPTQHVTIERAD